MPLYYRCKHVTILGTSYKVEKCCMLIGTTQTSSGCAPQFGLLHNIVLYGQEPSTLFIFIVLTTLFYNPVFGAYEVTPTMTYKCLYRYAMQCHHLFNAIHYGDNTNLFIKSKYDLSVYCHYWSCAYTLILNY